MLSTSLGLRGTLLLTAAVSALGFALTRVLPEPARVSLDDLAGGTETERTSIDATTWHASELRTAGKTASLSITTPQLPDHPAQRAG